MDISLLVGLIGAGATLVAALIGAYALHRTQQASRANPSPMSVSDTSLPYNVHRSEMIRKEIEARKLWKTVLLYRQQAQLVGEELARAKRYHDNLTDFFEGVTEKSTLELEVAVKTEDGKAAIFCNKKLKVNLLRIELFVGEKGLIFVAESGSRRHVGLPLTDEVVLPMAKHKPDKVLLVRMDPKTGKAVEGTYFPLRVYEPHVSEVVSPPLLAQDDA
jgi:hypothetical protein